MDPNSNMTSVLMRRGREDTDTTEGRPCEDIRRRWPPASQGETSDEINPADTSILDFQPPEL